MRQETSPQCELQQGSAVDAAELTNDPDHHVVLARRNLLVALAVTGMATLVDCGGKTGLLGASDTEEATPTSTATGGSGNFVAAVGGTVASTSDAAGLIATGGTVAVVEVPVDGGQPVALDADQPVALDGGALDSASWDATVDAAVLLDAGEEDPDVNTCVRGGCKYCASCGISGGMDAGDGDAWTDAAEADSGMGASAGDAAADADDGDAAIAVCGGCRSCASCGCT